MKEKNKAYPCPDCDHAPYADPRGLATHRRVVHGIAGTHTKTPKRKPQLSAQMQGKQRLLGDYPCPHCKFVAKWKGGLTHHLNAKHASKRSTALAPTKVSQVTASSNGHHPGAQADARRSLIPEATLALALGRFQELSKSIAIEHDLPPRTFATRLAEIIYATSLR